ncbi:hypothetical protein SLA2020_156480 [Shorea laevis]
MSAVDLYPNCRAQGVLSHCKTTAAKLLSTAKEAARVTLPGASPITSAALHGVNESRRTVVTMKTVGIDRWEIEAIFERKRSFRSKIRKQLKNMDPLRELMRNLSQFIDFKTHSASQIIVLESTWFKAGKSLCAYISSAALREVDTSRIVSEVLSDHAKKGKKLYVPRVEDNNSNMKMLKISTVDDLTASSMNILEPSLVDSDGNHREDVMQASDPVDLVILPGLAFDKSGSRLGHNGGYYDSFLKKYQELIEERKWKQPLLVTLSYSIQIMEEGSILVTPCDVPVDALVSPAGFATPISSAALKKCN